MYPNTLMLLNSVLESCFGHMVSPSVASIKVGIGQQQAQHFKFKVGHCAIWKWLLISKTIYTWGTYYMGNILHIHGEHTTYTWGTYYIYIGNILHINGEHTTYIWGTYYIYMGTYYIYIGNILHIHGEHTTYIWGTYYIYMGNIHIYGEHTTYKSKYQCYLKQWFGYYDTKW